MSEYIVFRREEHAQRNGLDPGVCDAVFHSLR